MTELSLRQAALRGAMGRCPCCGKGKLFARYLKQVDACSACGESFAGFRADDAAPWLTIIVIGHVFLPLAFMVDTSALPVGLVMAGMSALFAGLGAVLLPHAKGTILAVLWSTRASANPQIETA
jgi:uncharacterized protein (DUF983 family)